MIKPQDVRIGNWVFAGIIPVIIRGIHTKDILSHKDRGHFYVDNFVGEHYCFNDHDLEPIPLTEEVLLKAGFVMKENWLLSPLLAARIQIGYHMGYASDCSVLQDGKEIPLAAGKVKYVHQLQNLIYSLTGEELTINSL